MVAPWPLESKVLSGKGCHAAGRPESFTSILGGKHISAREWGTNVPQEGGDIGGWHVSMVSSMSSRHGENECPHGGACSGL